MTQIKKRIVGETGRPLRYVLGSEDGTLAASLPQDSTITVVGTRIDTGEVKFTGHTVTVTDWPTLAVEIPLVPGDVDTACTLRLRFQAIPLGGSAPTDVVDIPDDDDLYQILLKITPV